MDGACVSKSFFKVSVETLAGKLKVEVEAGTFVLSVTTLFLVLAHHSWCIKSPKETV